MNNVITQLGQNPYRKNSGGFIGWTEIYKIIFTFLISITFVA